MKKIPYHIVFVICLGIFSTVNYSKNNFTIYGVKGELLENIQARLAELDAQKPLQQTSDSELKEHAAKAMQPYGYFNPQISVNRPTLKLYIVAGPPIIIKRIDLGLRGEGAHSQEIVAIMNSLPFTEGVPFNSNNYEQGKQNLLNAADHQGYLHASFSKSEVLIDLKHLSAEIHLLFDTGPQYYFGQIHFDPTYISPTLLYRYVPFKFGQPYATEQILTFNDNLTNSGYFKTALVKPAINGARYVPIDVHLQRASRINYTLGLGYGTDTGPRGRAGLSLVPVNRLGHKFNALALGSFKENYMQAQYVIPGFNPITDQYSLNANFANLNYSSGYSNAGSLALAKQHTTANYQYNLSLNVLDERYKYVLQPKQEKLTVYPKATFTWSKISDKLFSPSGYNITVNGLVASKVFLSNTSFMQASVNAKAALMLPYLRTRFYFHTIQGVTSIGNINQLPLSLALLLGGADTMKAYSYNSIGPGKILTYGGIEIQKETKDRWYFVGFFDTGDVYKPNMKNLQNDIGLGLMWVSPVGPIKIGIAQAVNNHFRFIKEKKPKLVINMGPDL